MPKTKVTKTVSQSGEREFVQYRLTVPKDIAEAFDLEGVEMEWTVKSSNTLELTKTE